jgi:CDP-paratose 2-epimerase
MTTLITGGCGFVGSNIAATLLRLDRSVTIFDNLSRTGAKDNLAWLQKFPTMCFLPGDIRDSHQVDDLIKNKQPDTIFHLAGQVAMTTSIQNPRLDFEINAGGTLNLLEAVRRFSPEATVVYSSSNKVYGDLEYLRYEESSSRYVCTDYPLGFDESLPLSFHSPYGCSKGAADQYVLDYSRMFGLKTVVFRHSSMYGDRQFATYDQGWVGWFCGQAILAKHGRGTKFTISGSGKQVRDVLHAEDVVTCYLDAARNITLVQGNAFNIGGGMNNSLSLLELFKLLEELTGTELQYKNLPPRSSDQKVFVADNSRIHQLTGWKPTINSREGVNRALTWAEANLETLTPDPFSSR